MKRHGFEPAALVTGLVLLGLAAVFALDAAGGRNVESAEAVTLTVLGLVLALVVLCFTKVVRSMTGARNRRQG